MQASTDVRQVSMHSFDGCFVAPVCYGHPLPGTRLLGMCPLFCSFFPPGHPTTTLSLQQLSAKLVTLLSLISYRRISDVCELDWGLVHLPPDGVSFTLPHSTKTGLRFDYSAFPLNPKLCPVPCLKAYKLLTSSFCEHHPSSLFVSLHLINRCPAPHLLDGCIGHYQKWASIFQCLVHIPLGAHLLHTENAWKIFLRATDCSHESSFRQFYFRPPPHVFSVVVAQP